MVVYRKAYWSLAAAVVLFFILLNRVHVQDYVARAFGYAGSVPMFELDQMIRGYTPEKVFNVLTAYGPNGRRAYAFLLLTCDLVFPFLYGSFLFLSIRMAAQRAGISGAWSSRLAACGYAATGFDWLENLSFLFLMRIYPGESIPVARLASLFTVTKFSFFGASVIILAGLGIYILGKSFRSIELTKWS
jgi:hypothetical protein